jgi:ABC-type nickel/cobalt efflux system permease component RcnA
VAAINDSVLAPIAITGFGIAFFHAAIPTHWLPFVLTARAQRWSRAKTLFITALAGSGHVLATAVLGLVVAWLGIALSERIGIWFPRIAGAALLIFGLFYIWQQWRGHAHTHLHWFVRHDHPHGHTHEPEHEHDHHHDHDHVHARAEEEHYEALAHASSDWAAILSLLALLTFSPCEAFIPIYVSGVRYGWSGFALLTIILSLATVAGMLVFTFLALAGIEQIKLQWFEKHESGVMGALLCLVGLLIIIFEK